MTEYKHETADAEEYAAGMSPLEIVALFAEERRRLILVPLFVGIVALGISFLVKPTFTSRTTFLPPQQQQGGAASALASLGSLAGLIGGGSAIKTPGDQYVSLMQSAAVADRIIDRFKLMEVYESKYRFEARRSLADDVRITLGKKDGLVSVEVDAHDAALGANIANAYVTELRELTSKLQLTEAQSRRAFYQAELERTSKALAAAQAALQSSGFNPGALKAEPKAAAEAYSRMQASVTENEVRLMAMRRNLADTAPEVQQQLGILAGLRERLARIEAQTPQETEANYVGKYREYKYQETLFELFSKQYEMARLDATQEGTLIQVIDAATPAEHKSRPKRGMVAVSATLAAGIAMALWLLCRHWWRHPAQAETVARLNQAWRKPRN